MRQPLKEITEQRLNAMFRALEKGELRLGELPLAVEQFFYLGWAERHRQALDEAREVEHRLDLAYLALVHPKDRARQLQERLQTHFEAEAERFFAEPELPVPASLERRAA